MEPLKLAEPTVAPRSKALEQDRAVPSQEPKVLDDWEMVLVGGGETTSCWP